MKTDNSDTPRTRRTHPSFQYTDLTAVEEYLADMAFDGWRLVSIRNGFTFEECAPCKLRYSVEILPTASQVSNEVTAESQAYIDLCAEAGWSFVANAADLYVFVTSDPDAPPIVSDSREKIDAVRRAGKKRRAPLWALAVLNLFNTGLQCVNVCLNPRAFHDMLPLLILMAALDVLLVGVLISQAVQFGRWHRRAEQALAEGIPFTYYDKRVLRRRAVFGWSVVGLMAALIIGAALWDCLRGGVVGLIVLAAITVGVALLLPVILWLNRSSFPAEKMILLSVLLGLAFVIILILLVVVLMHTFY